MLIDLMTEEQAQNFEMIGLAVRMLSGDDLEPVVDQYVQLQRRRNRRLKSLAKAYPTDVTPTDVTPTQERDGE